VNRSPGWYPDPASPEKLKWWNGSAWTNEPQSSSGVPSSPSGYLAPASAQPAPSLPSQQNAGFSYSSAQGQSALTFEESIKTCFAKYATFSGRATRSEYWFFALFYFLVVLGSLFVFAIFENDYLALLGAIAWIALLLPTTSSLVRRLHDTGKSGWWYWLSLVPIGGIVVIVFLCQPSEPSANRYGPQN
jgi:uncharacterized membrane protein YhaH (DUF805 family)